MHAPISDLLTIEEFAGLVRRSPSTIRWWIQQGSEAGPLFAKIGRRRMCRRADAEQWVADRFGEPENSLRDASTDELRAELDRPGGAA